MENITQNNKKLKFPSELAWDETILAIKKSSNFNSFEDFSEHLVEFLPQNSVETRKRYAQMIFQRYFSNKTLNQLCVDVWKYYQDDALLRDILRYLYLTAEPLVGEFVFRHLMKRNNESVSRDTFSKFSIELYGAVNNKLLQRLSATLKGLGFIQNSSKKGVFSALSVRQPKTALLILVHYLFAKTPKTVMVEELLNDRFWQYIGIRWQDDVRNILRDANAKGLLAKYIVADQLEQITTKYSYQEILEKRVMI